MKKVLVINGSPRRKGLISRMLDIMIEEAEFNGCEVDVIRANDLNVRPCMGCMVCRSKNACVLPKDDSVEVLQKLQQADVVVIGAPCYWGNLPGQLKLLFDRMVYGMMRDTAYFPEPLMKGKKSVLVSTSTTPWPWNILFRQTRGVIRALREILHYSGIKIVKTIERGSTAKHQQLSERDKKKCRKAILCALK